MKSRYLIMSVVLILAGFSTQALAKSDTAFLNEAIQINLAEISVGDLAQKNGGSDDVKSFGKMLVDDHTASNTKATSLARGRPGMIVVLSMGVSFAHKVQASRRNVVFDRLYGTRHFSGLGGGSGRRGEGM